ncbi:uncharacterized protein LOC132174219 [Corylus avellana]|uniref:uncharacterized protein LOC132165956 n=1 Tax=Corylus avellana TaxID=13451 RepID=UPI00286ACFC9|nr:uncharacterized protein LOC132165956 [Corylus avellana]XP_059441894.1 uncharacterized protein LOC132174219 [Corylus avellana]
MSDLSDFEVTNGEEEDIFLEKDEALIRQTKEETTKWFQSWYQTETSKNVGDISNEPDEDDSNSDGGILSIDNDDGSEGSPRHVRRKYPQWMPKADLKEIVELYIGQEFVDTRQFNDALQIFAIQNSFDYTYMRNEKTRITSICKRTCGWRIHASWSYKRDCFQIKSYIKEHNCGTHYYNKKASIKWAANRYLEIFRDEPNFRAIALKEMIRRDYNVDMTLSSCHRAKKMALGILTGKKAYKRGFLEACRPMICVDACFLKSEFVGQLHAAVARDVNDDIYPLAYDICECEDQHTWTWFLSCLLEDIGNPRVHTWSFMSNRQKGLLNAMEDLMPGLEHQLCLRHLHANFKRQGFKGKAYKDAFDGAARAANELQFKHYMSVIRGMSEDAFDYISKIDPRTWSSGEDHKRQENPPPLSTTQI